MADASNEEIIHRMVGRSVETIYRREPGEAGEERLRVEDLSAPPLRNVSLTLRAGEITGLAGLVGSGRTELCRALFGIGRPVSGRIRVEGRELRAHSPRDAVRAGMALIPEDRQRHGLAVRLPLDANMTLPSLRRLSRRMGWIDAAAESRLIGDFCARLRIKASSPSQPAGSLSGGNQQKLVIAKWMIRQARILLFDEPARGVDIAAKAEVFALMDELARQGAAILMVSSEWNELSQMADRILVMRAGRIAGELPRGSSPEQMMRLAALPSEVTR